MNDWQTPSFTFFNVEFLIVFRGHGTFMKSEMSFFFFKISRTVFSPIPYQVSDILTPFYSSPVNTSSSPVQLTSHLFLLGYFASFGTSRYLRCVVQALKGYMFSQHFLSSYLKHSCINNLILQAGSALGVLYKDLGTLRFLELNQQLSEISHSYDNIYC